MAFNIAREDLYFALTKIATAGTVDYRAEAQLAQKQLDVSNAYIQIFGSDDPERPFTNAERAGIMATIWSAEDGSRVELLNRLTSADDFYKRGAAQADDTREVIAEIFKRNANDPEQLIDDMYAAYSSELEVDIDHYVDYFGLSGQLNPVYSKIKNFALSVFDRFRALFKPYS